MKPGAFKLRVTTELNLHSPTWEDEPGASQRRHGGGGFGGGGPRRAAPQRHQVRRVRATRVTQVYENFGGGVCSGVFNVCNLQCSNVCNVCNLRCPRSRCPRSRSCLAPGPRGKSGAERGAAVSTRRSGGSGGPTVGNLQVEKTHSLKAPAFNHEPIK